MSQRLEARSACACRARWRSLEGLKAGDVVATAGQARLLRGDGVPVRVIDISKPAAAVAAGGPEPGAAGPGAASAAPAGAALSPTPRPAKAPP